MFNISFLRSLLLLFFLVGTTFSVISQDQGLYQREPSFFSLPIEIPIGLIEKTVNAQLGNVIYDDNSYTRPTADDLKLKVYKRETIVIHGKGEELFIKIPLKIWGQVRWKACQVCPEMEKQTIFDIDVFLRSRVDVLPDYSFKLRTQSDGFEWKRKPEISFGFININISHILEKTIQDQLKSIASDIDYQVNQTLALRSHVQSLWNLGEEIFLVDDSTNTWLRLNPHAVYFSPVRCDAAVIHLTLGVESFVETFIGSKPTNFLKTKLPDLILSQGTNRKISLNAIAHLSFEEATRLAKLSSLGLSFGDKKRKAIITDISVRGKEEFVLVDVKLEGKWNGLLQISGKPEYSSASNELRFSNLEFDLKSRNLLLKAAKWLSADAIARKLQEALVFSFEQDVISVKNKLDARFSNYTYQDVFTIKGNLHEFKVQQLIVSESGFVIILNAEGNAVLKLKSISF